MPYKKAYFLIKPLIGLIGPGTVRAESEKQSSEKLQFHAI